MRRLLPLLIALGCSYPIQDLVTTFPVGNIQYYPSTPSFATFSGYLNIPNSGGKSLHYMFVESQNNPEKDPLVLWLNGGPGCSSLDGFYYEHGPYLFYTPEAVLLPNPYSWNLNANVIYLESPAGVGYSVLGVPANMNTSDTITAHDNLEAMLQWFMKFPEYARHDFYITGESYGGVYVPTLSLAIVNYNQEVGYDQINLRGFAVGNGVTDWSVDCNTAMLEMAWSHNWMPPQWNTKWQTDCVNPLSQACNQDFDEFADTLLVNVNQYSTLSSDLYGECFPVEGFENYRYTPWLKHKHHKLGDVPPCLDAAGAQAYLSLPEVKAAFHISSNAAKNWEICTDNGVLNYTSLPQASFWAYPDLIAAGLKIMIYSGDVDGSVPFIGTRKWISMLDMVMVQDHKQWYVDDQVAGWFEVYSGLTFVTVRGAGHMVPQYKPAAALKMLNFFLQNQPLA